MSKNGCNRIGTIVAFYVITKPELEAREFVLLSIHQSDGIKSYEMNTKYHHTHQRTHLDALIASEN
jgi:hypothetical protein